jgi:hypothetical protein
LAEIVREGQEQGTIRSDADPYYVSWLLVSRSWTEDVSYLMGVSDQWMGERSNRMLNEILEAIKPPVGASSGAVQALTGLLARPYADSRG